VSCSSRVPTGAHCKFLLNSGSLPEELTYFTYHLCLELAEGLQQSGIVGFVDHSRTR
jgi:hypothetical protein